MLRGSGKGLYKLGQTTGTCVKFFDLKLVKKVCQSTLTIGISIRIIIGHHGYCSLFQIYPHKFLASNQFASSSVNNEHDPDGDLPKIELLLERRQIRSYQKPGELNSIEYRAKYLSVDEEAGNGESPHD